MEAKSGICPKIRRRFEGQIPLHGLHLISLRGLLHNCEVGSSGPLKMNAQK